MGKIVGRSDDMLIIRGVNVFPTQIEEIVLQSPRLSGQYQLVVGREGPLDTLRVRTELNVASVATPPAEIDELKRWLQHRIKTLVGVSTSIEVLPPDSIERTVTGKARRVLDQRKP
jgi:phenylacetate-CoA ligase